MLRTVLWALAAAVAVGSHLRRGAWTTARVRARLALLALGLVAWRGLDLAEALRGGRTSLATLAARAALGLVLWFAIAELVSVGRRGRDLVGRGLLLALTFVAGAAGASTFATTATTASGLLSARWRSPFATRALLRLALAAVALLVVASWRIAPSPAEPAHGLARDLARFAGWAHACALIYVGFAALALFAAFVRDPSLGIRTVSRRLALSHVLVVAVPLLLTVLLWLATTVLGVSADRARAATRALESEAQTLEADLHATLAAPERERDWVSRWTAARRGRWPRVSVWLARDTAWSRVEGAAVPGEPRLRAWVDSLGPLPGSALVSLGDSIFLGAAARAGDPSRAAVALVPASTFLAGVPQRLAGATLSIHRSVAATAERWTVDGGAGADSARSARAHSSRSDAGGGVTISTPRDTFLAAPRGTPLRSVLFSGYAVVPGIAPRGDGWATTHYLIAASVEPRAVVWGLSRSARENPIGILPVLFLAVLAIVFGLVALFDLVMVANMGRSITSAIRALRAGAQRLEAGDLAHRIPVEGEDDLWQVAEAFNTAAVGLERGRRIEQERNRLESELAVARQIQARLLPESPPEVAGLEIAGLSESAREVGGDYYDHVPLGDGRVLLVVADVSGKGVPAALLMSGFRASLMSQDLPRADLPGLASRLNDFVVRSVRPGRFITACIAVLDGGSGRIEYVNAGHNPPVLLRAGGGHETLTAGGPMLGVVAGARFDRGAATLGAGELLVLYTDGVTEGAGAGGELWGEERLLDALRRRITEPCAALVAGVAAEVRGFEGEQGPADDVTLLAARRAIRG